MCLDMTNTLNQHMVALITQQWLCVTFTLVLFQKRRWAPLQKANNIPTIMADCDKQTRLKCVVLIATVTVCYSILVVFQKGRLEAGNTKGGSITVPLTSCLTGLESAVWLLTVFFYLQNRLIQTSQTGGQWYSDTSPFSIPCWRAWLK
jgi:hypothetical protein